LAASWACRIGGCRRPRSVHHRCVARFRTCQDLRFPAPGQQRPVIIGTPCYALLTCQQQLGRAAVQRRTVASRAAQVEFQPSARRQPHMLVAFRAEQMPANPARPRKGNVTARQQIHDRILPDRQAPNPMLSCSRLCRPAAAERQRSTDRPALWRWAAPTTEQSGGSARDYQGVLHHRRSPPMAEQAGGRATRLCIESAVRERTFCRAQPSGHAARRGSSFRA
jgi:hypothetical protein